jgi:Tol biopolymer transport system component
VSALSGRVKLHDRIKTDVVFKKTNMVLVRAYSIRGGSPIKTIAPPNGFGGNVRWMPDGRSIAYVVDKNNVGNIWAQPIDGGTALST